MIIIGKSPVLLLMMAQTVAFVCVVLTLQHKTPPPVKEQGRTHILILSSWRSGSSFTGQLFSQHPDVFYLMEPAWHVWASMHQNSYKVLHMTVRDLVRSVFLCDMSVFDPYIQSRKYTSNLFQWETSRALCSPPACKSFQRNDIIPQSHCKILCSIHPFDNIEQACRTYSHVALKEVRFLDLKVLYPLLKDPSLNLKILHLVRDPRGVFHSRKKTKGQLTRDNNILMWGVKRRESEDNEYEVMQKICRSQVEMYQTAIKANITGLQNRYLLVRYEDIVNEPVLKARKMYQFAKLRFTPHLEAWIYNITHGNGQGQNFVISSRDAQHVSKAWRNVLPFKTTERLQNICGEALDVFGYRHFKNEKNQKNSSLDVLVPIPRETNAELYGL
ncbi:carbohydrate sulfotransferase 4 [Pelodytes ibericus]